MTWISKPLAAGPPHAAEALATRVEGCLREGRRAPKFTANRGGRQPSTAHGADQAHRKADADAKPIVWLASYPKSGNTWLRTLLTNYLNEGEGPASINALVGSPELILREEFDERIGLPSSDLTPGEILHYRAQLHEQLGAELAHPSFYKVHDACLRTEGGNLLFPPGATHGTVYLVRNPLDVAVSYAHHWGWPIARAVAELCRPDAALSQHATGIHHVLPQPLLTWSGHVASWLGELPMHVVRYEDMLADSEGCLGAILRFTGFEPDGGRVAQAVALSHFNRLRAQEERFGFNEKPMDCSSFFRSGKAGAWRAALSHEQVRTLTAAHAGAMERFGYLREAEAFLAGTE